MLQILENYDQYAKNTFKNSIEVHEKFDWDRVTENTSNQLKKILKTRGF